MKLSLNWLNDYIDPKLSTDALVQRLTMAGLEVEGIDMVGRDTVLELEITPNRPDCLNILGLAREVGAITGKIVKYPSIKPLKKTKPSFIVSVDDKKDCRRYIATLISNTRIEPSASHIRTRLESLGIRPINNAVDITNFVMMEHGQPLHAFDYDKLQGGKIIVRRAKEGESIITIDGIERKLDPTILVIADAVKPVAIAGIMGGKATEITATTKHILLESAHFDLGLVRRAGRSLGLKSDSSYRFERGVPFEGVLMGADRATNLLLVATAGQVTARVEQGLKTTARLDKITVSVEQIASLLGTKVSSAQAVASLTRLGFKVTKKGQVLTVLPPANRGDITQTVDLIEEIARIIGFDNLPSKLPLIKARNIAVDQRPREVKKNIRRVLNACGIDEVMTYAMTNTKALLKSNYRDTTILKVFNPLNQDQELMRPTLLPSLLQVALTNINRGQKDIRIFEIGKEYMLQGEKDTVAILLTGRRSQDWRGNKKDMVDIADLKGPIEHIAAAFKMNLEAKPAKFSEYDPGCAAQLVVNGKVIGALGRVAFEVCQQWGIKNQEVYFASVDVTSIYGLPQPRVKYKPLSEFPAINRDVSIAVVKETPYARIETICRFKGGSILRSVQFIEQYVGDKIQEGYKGLVFSCQYQSHEATLREEDVNAAHQQIIDALKNELGAILR